MQKRLMRMLPGLERQSYKERLGRLGLHSLKHKRLKDDLVEVSKIMWVIEIG